MKNIEAKSNSKGLITWLIIAITAMSCQSANAQSSRNEVSEIGWNSDLAPN